MANLEQASDLAIGEDPMAISVADPVAAQRPR
jgi:hypothetical protein